MSSATLESIAGTGYGPRQALRPAHIRVFQAIQIGSKNGRFECSQRSLAELAQVQRHIVRSAIIALCRRGLLTVDDTRGATNTRVYRVTPKPISLPTTKPDPKKNDAVSATRALRKQILSLDAGNRCAREELWQQELGKSWAKTIYTEALSTRDLLEVVQAIAHYPSNSFYSKAVRDAVTFCKHLDAIVLDMKSERQSGRAGGSPPLKSFKERDLEIEREQAEHRRLLEQSRAAVHAAKNADKAAEYERLEAEDRKKYTAEARQKRLRQRDALARLKVNPTPHRPPPVYDPSLPPPPKPEEL